jgi:pyrroloquinoline quinone biosynthesis protein A
MAIVMLIVLAFLFSYVLKTSGKPLGETHEDNQIRKFQIFSIYKLRRAIKNLFLCTEWFCSRFAVISGTLRRHTMKWQTPAASDMRFGFEITMYIANR